MTDFSYQLYSSRNFPPLGDTLRMVAQAGYSQVEGFGGLFAQSDALAAGLAENRLAMPSAHVGLDLLENDPDQVLALARKLDWAAVFVPSVAANQRPADAAGWSGFGQRLARAGAPVQAAGLEFGWHNHDFEFTKMADGSFPIEAMLDAAPDLKLELDLAWVKAAGQDPVDWITRFADRILAVHLKDIAPEGQNVAEDGWADVGHGIMDWPAINAALASSAVRYRVIEHDNPSDHHRFAQRSIATARTF